MQLKFSILSINTVIEARRITFLHCLMNTNEIEMLYQLIRLQLDQPVQSDWMEQIKIDIFDFNIGMSLDENKLNKKRDGCQARTLKHVLHQLNF